MSTEFQDYAQRVSRFITPTGDAANLATGEKTETRVGADACTELVG
jgi:hypothetical protein